MLHVQLLTPLKAPLPSSEQQRNEKLSALTESCFYLRRMTASKSYYWRTHCDAYFDRQTYCQSCGTAQSWQREQNLNKQLMALTCPEDTHAHTHTIAVTGWCHVQLGDKVLEMTASCWTTYIQTVCTCALSQNCPKRFWNRTAIFVYTNWYSRASQLKLVDSVSCLPLRQSCNKTRPCSTGFAGVLLNSSHLDHSTD